MSVGLAGLVAEFLEQAQGLPEVRVGLVVAAKPGQCLAEAAVGVGLPVPVGAMLGGDQRGVLDIDPVMPVPPPREEFHQRPRELPGMGGLPGVGRELDGPQQDRILRLEPG